MKTLLPFFILAIFLLGSCTETIYEEVIKLDTVYVSKPQSLLPTFITVRDTIKIVDTVRVETIITKTDTLIQIVTKDSLIIKEVEKIVYHTDTVEIVNTVVNNVHTTDTVLVVQHDTVTLTEYVQRVVYLNTEYIFPGNSVTFIPDALMPYYLQFIQEAQSRGINLIGGDLIITYVDPADLPGENWISNTFEMAGNQQIIQLSSELIAEQSRAAIYREMARWQLKKKYSNDATKIMSNLFRASPEPTSQEINTLFQ